MVLVGYMQANLDRKQLIPCVYRIIDSLLAGCSGSKIDEYAY